MMNKTYNITLDLLKNPNGKFNPGKCRLGYLARQHPELYAQILACTAFLDEDSTSITMGERLYCIESNIHEIQKCSGCGKRSQYIVKGTEYRYRMCSICASHNQVSHEKRKQTMQAKYGDGNFFKTARFNTLKDNTLEKLGVVNVSQLQEVKDKVKRTNLEKWGVEYPSQNEAVKARIAQTNKLNWGCASATQKHLLEGGQLTLLQDKDYLFNEYVVLQNSASDIARGLQVPVKLVCDYLDKHDIEKRPNINRSRAEKDLYAFVVSRLPPDTAVETNARIIPTSKLELDIYIPSLKLGIEFNGDYWHSLTQDEENTQTKNKHLKKLELCSAQGISLIQIKEHQFVNKRDIVLSMLSAKMGCIENKIAARKCVVRQVSVKEAQAFLLHNHIQGPCSASQRMGLYFNDELVSLITFAKPRYNGKYGWELIRYACKLNTTVVGGFSRLMADFRKKHPTEAIISYSDRMYSAGDVYIKNGFTLLHHSPPSYEWLMFEGSGEPIRTSRFKSQKHKLLSLPGYSAGMTEADFMFKQGHRRLWDCGTSAWLLQNRQGLITLSK